eukprot:7690683-Ditylum_brightwellii.AAC.1
MDDGNKCKYPTSMKNEHPKGEAYGDLYDNIWSIMVEKGKNGEATDTSSDEVKMKIIIFGYTVE